MRDGGVRNRSIGGGEETETGGMFAGPTQNHIQRLWAHRHSAADWDRQTLEQWINENSARPRFKRLVPAATRPIFGAEPREISLSRIVVGRGGVRGPAGYGPAATAWCLRAQDSSRNRSPRAIRRFRVLR